MVSRNIVASSPMVMRPFISRMRTPSRSLCSISRLMMRLAPCGDLYRHLIADLRFYFLDRHHLDRVPRTAIEERAIRALADAFLAADAELRIHFDPAVGRMIFVGNPKHAVSHRTVRHASRRPGASRATLGDNG